MRRRKSPKMNIFQLSWFILKQNKQLFVPNLLALTFNLLLFLGFFFISGLSTAIFRNDYELLGEAFFSVKFLVLIVLYFLITFFADNYFLTMKYGLIQNVLLKGKVDLTKGIKFANKYYLTTIGIHILSALIIFIPLILLAALLFLLLPFGNLVAMTLFLPIAIIYFFYISIRLIFIYPIMTFERKGAYASLKEDFHFVKSHLHHTILTWLIVMGIAIFASIIKENLINATEMIYSQIVLIGFLVVGAILIIEISVSVWEHIFIFKSYLVAKKKR